MADTGNGHVVTRSDGGGLKDLGDLCENVEHQAREAKYATAAGDARSAAERIERVLDEEARLRLAYRRWLATTGAVSDSRMST